MKTINHSGGIWLSKSREISSVIMDNVAQEWVIIWESKIEASLSLHLSL